MKFQNQVVMFLCLVYLQPSLQVGTCPGECQCDVNWRGIIWTCKPNITDSILQKLAMSGDSKEVNSLDLYGNYIRNFPSKLFANFTSLRYINLGKNLLHKPPKSISRFIPSLKELALNENKISSISKNDILGYGSIEVLVLSRNTLTSLPKGFFNSIKYLLTLALEHNHLVDDGIPPNSFNNIGKLVLCGNNLTTLKKEWFGGVIENRVIVSDNPIHCDCTLYETYQMLMNRTIENFEIDGNCASPPLLKGKKIKDVYNLANCTACSLNKCQNNATCHEVNSNTYTCKCTTNKYYGRFCQNEKYCYKSPCLNNGTCSTTNTTFMCACKEGYIGKRCEVEQPCFFSNLCLHNGTCSYVNGTFNYLCN